MININNQEITNILIKRYEYLQLLIDDYSYSGNKIAVSIIEDELCWIKTFGELVYNNKHIGD